MTARHDRPDAARAAARRRPVGVGAGDLLGIHPHRPAFTARLPAHPCLEGSPTMPAPSTRVNTGRRPAAPASRYRPGFRTRHAAQPALAPAAERETASQHARRTCRVRFGVTAVLALAWSSPRSLRRSGCQSSSSMWRIRRRRRAHWRPGPALIFRYRPGRYSSSTERIAAAAPASPPCLVAQRTRRSTMARSCSAGLPYPPRQVKPVPQYPADEFGAVQADAQLADRRCRVAPPGHARLQFGVWPQPGSRHGR